MNLRPWQWPTERLIRISAVLALAAIALMTWGLLDSSVIAIMVAMTAGQAIGTLSLILYLLVLWRSLETARVARDRVGAFLAAGITAGLAFQVVYNVAMVAGLVPVKGLPLPFMSYGGSSVIYSFLAVGLILNVRMRRFAN